MAWTTPQNVSTGIASASQFNTETVANLQYLYEGLSWTDFTPTWSGVTLGTGGSSLGRYRRINNVVEFQAGFMLGTGGSVTGPISLTGPLTTANDDSVLRGIGVAIARDSSTSLRYSGGFFSLPNSTTWINRLCDSNGVVGWDSNVPYTWDDGDELHASGTLTVA